MRISTYYYAGFGGADFSNDIDWNDIVIEDPEKIDEIIIAAANGEEIEELDCIQALLDVEYDKAYDAEVEMARENSYYDDDDDDDYDDDDDEDEDEDDEDEDEDFDFDGEITMHIYTTTFQKEDVEACLRRLFEKKDYETIHLIKCADSESFEDLDLSEIIKNLSEEFGVSLED